MSVNERSIVPGLILIALGFIFLAHNLGWMEVHWHTLWPWLVLGAGVLFWGMWLVNRRNYGVLMPGTILLVYGFMFVYSTQTGWWNMERLWPLFLLGPGLGFFMLYVFGEREQGLLIPGAILSGLAVFFLLGRGQWHLFWPIILIIIGVILLFKSRSKLKTETAEQESTSSGTADAGENQ